MYCGQVLQDQPLVVAVPRTAPPGAALPPLDAAAAAGQLLLRPGLMPVTCHGTTAAAVAGATPSLSLSAHVPLTVNTAVPTSMLPLGVVVTTDVNKVRHLSPEMAKNFLQQTGQ